MLENIRGDSRGSIPPLRMPSLLPHDLCHEWNVSRQLPATSGSRHRGKGEVWRDSSVHNMFPVPESSRSMRLRCTCHPPVLWGFLIAYWKTGLLRWLSGKQSPCQGRKCMFDPWSGKIPWRGNGNPLQYSCLGNPMERGAWWATVHGKESDNLQQQKLINFFFLLWLLWVSRVT